MRGLLASLVAVIVATLIVFPYSHDAAWLVGYGGTLLVLAGTLLYIVLIDSRKRWPGVSASQRFARVITYYRD